MTDWLDDYLKKKEQEEAEEKAKREVIEKAEREAVEKEIMVVPHYWMNAVAVIIENGSVLIPNNPNGTKYEYRDVIVVRSICSYDRSSLFSYYYDPMMQFENFSETDKYQEKEDVILKLKNLLAEDYRNRDFTSFFSNYIESYFQSKRSHSQTIVYIGEINSVPPTGGIPVKEKSVLKRLKDIFGT